MSAVFFWPGQLAYGPQEMFIRYSAFIFLGLSFFVPAKRQISNVYLGLILLMALAHTLFYSFKPISQSALANICLGLLTVKIVAERINLDLKSIGYLYAGLAVLNIVMLIFQYFDMDPFFMNIDQATRKVIIPCGMMGAQYALGCIGALMTPFLFAANPWLCLLVVPLLVFGKASTAVLAFAFSFCFLMWFRNRVVFWSLVSFFVIGALAYVVFLDYPTGQFMKRLNIWWFGLFQMRLKPYFGYGLGGWFNTGITSMQQNGQPEQWTWAHNEFLQYFYEFGLFGMFFLYAYFKNFIKKIQLWNKDQQVMVAAFISLSLVSFFHFPFHIGRLAGISILILALMEAHTSRIENEKNNSRIDTFDTFPA